MLLELRLKDFVLIDEARLLFEPGFVVFTGETGAGKTLLVKGLHLLLGARGGPALIKPGAREAILEAVFSVGEELSQKLEEAGIAPGDEIYIRRIIGRERSRAYVNDSPVTLGFLADLAQDLLVVASQHDHQSLNRPEERLRMIDAHGGLFELRAKYQGLYERYRQIEREYQALQQRLQELLKEEDFLRFQISEIEEIAPQPGEDVEIEQRLAELKNLARLEEDVKASLREFERALSAWGSGRKALERAASISKGLEKLASRAETVFLEAEDLLFELQEFARNLTPSEGELERLEERFYQLRRLKRKYGPTLEDVLTHLEKAKKELETFSHGEESLLQLEKELADIREELEALAAELREKRLEAAQRLAREIRQYFEELALTGMRFEIVLEKGELSWQGTERAEFLVATQPQAPLRPVAQIASGGELSRLFLALKTATASDTSGQTLVFDEVDVGVGGETASRVGRLLKKLARKHQVLCITHQPQIAALADQHFLVEKNLSTAEASTSIHRLEAEERVREIARMLGGAEAEDLARRMLAS